MKDYHEMAARVLQRRDEYVEARRKRNKRMVPLVGCVCLAALVGVGSWQAGVLPSAGSGVDGGVTGMQLDGDPYCYAEQGGITDQSEEMQNGEVDPEAVVGYEDAPAQGPYLEDMDVSPALSDVWGGSYLDGTGHIVALLTEDTPANRALVFQEHPEWREDQVRFQTAAHSLAYLTELQENITQGMIDGKLPFVTVSSLMEAENKLRLTVTSQNAGDLALLRAFDKTGTALDIQISVYVETEPDPPVVLPLS